MISRLRDAVGCRGVAALIATALIPGMFVLTFHDPVFAANIVLENGPVEWMQVVLLLATGVLAARQGWEARAAGEPYVFEVAVVAVMIMAAIGEVDPDRMIFGTKVISTQFFVNPKWPLWGRLLAVLISVGAPLVLGLWLLRHVRELLRTSLGALWHPWGQTTAAGLILYMLVEVFEKHLKHVPYLPPYAAEETLELVAAVVMFVGILARRRAIMGARMRANAVLVMISLAVLLSGCRGETVASADQPKPKPQALPAKEVAVKPAAERTLAKTVAATGTLAADEQVVLGTKVAGRVAEVSVDLGTPVRRGQVIGRLDQSDFKLRVDQAEAALQQARVRLGLSPTGTDERVDPEQTAIVRQARAVLEEARLTRDRSIKLMEQDLIARAQLDTAEANLKVAEGRYQDALEEVRNRQAIIAQRRSELDLARQQLTDAVLVSPIDGAVSLKQASVGEYLGAGAPVATLVRLHPLRLRVPVPEREGAGVRTGQTVKLTVEGDTTVYGGRVVRLSPIVQEQNRTLMVEAEIPNERAVLRPGSFARVEIVTDTGRAVVTVPATSIIIFAGVEKVLVVRQGKTAEVRVTTGRRLGEDVEIVDGLKRGEAVVAVPGNLTGGQSVTVR
ncbi:MAG TPA: efflux RND transporter periplasmic adaptor subunit [Methylomirabilota bacterium]|nr:efflux RND transporter periplasmic adaptor subunit [Methylomirabilota bacterium]